MVGKSLLNFGAGFACCAVLAMVLGWAVQPQTPPAKAPDATYTVRGEVVELPEQGKPQKELRIHHQAIDDFKDMKGTVVGMNSMTMEFPPAKGVTLDGIKVGDKVEIVFSVWWGEAPPWLATKITKLPADTKLEFGKADVTKAKGAAPTAVPAAEADEIKHDPETIKKLPAAVIAAIKAARPRLKIEDAESEESDGLTVWTVTGTEQKLETEFVLTEGGLVLNQHETVETDKLPAEFVAAIMKKYPDAKLKDATRTTGAAYSVMLKAGKKSYVAVLSGDDTFVIEPVEDEDPVPEMPANKPKGPGF